MALFGQAAQNASNTLGVLDKDIQLQNGPEDSISKISCSMKTNHIAVASWDKKVRIYEINAGGGKPETMFEHEAPVLDCDWSRVCSSVICSTDVR
jgi:mRNA export factor